MPRNDDFALPPILMSKWTPGFGAVDYTVELAGPYEITNPLQAIQQEAGAKGCVVVVNIGLIPADEYYGKPVQEGDPSNDSEPQPS